MFDKEFWKQVEEEIALGYINVQKHPTESLWIYNYGNSAMFDGRWNEATMNCRGLIVDENKKIIARGFKKFFNLDQAESYGLGIPYGENFEVYDKVDGSLGILFRYDGNFHFATRGSFSSDQAIEANKIFNEKYSDVYFRTDVTHLFEIIYPNNRIVVDYGDKRDLILLGMIENESGREVDLSEAPFGLNIVTRYHGISDFSKALNQFDKLSGTEFEGLVVRFTPSNFRIKLKTEDYKKLHKLYTGLSERDIWDCISSGIGLQEIVSTAPDEMFDWIKQVEKKLREDYNRIESIAKMLYIDAQAFATNLNPPLEFKKDQTFKELLKAHRKSFAQFVLKCENPVLKSVAFQMYGNGEYHKIIWESIYPSGNKKFKNVSDIE